MAQYRKDYILEHNIDWFGCVNGIWVYAASRGGLLPARVDDNKYLPRLQGVCSNLPVRFSEDEIEINEALIDERYSRAVRILTEKAENLHLQIDNITQEFPYEEFRRNFTDLFLSMACRGFYSFVRIDIDDPYSTEYRLVAYPRKGIPVNLDDIIQTSFHPSLIDEEYLDFIDNLKVSDDKESLTVQSNLNIMFR